MRPQQCDLIVKASNMLPGGSSESSVINAAIAIKDGLIAGVGTSRDVEEKWTAPEIKDMGNALLMPGLINAHTHVPMTFLRGFADDLPLLDWLTKHIFPLEAQLTAEIVALGARLGMYEMMRTGTTAFVDSYLLEETVFETADKMGMRCVGGEVLFAFPSRTYSNFEEAKELCKKHAGQYPKGGRVQTALMPHSVYTTNDEMLRDAMQLAQDEDLMFHIHLSESAGEVAQCKELHQGRRPVEYARDMGLLNQRTVLAHMVDMIDEELHMVKESGAQIVHNPVSNLKLASGLARVAEMRKLGISVALGTDGACSNNTLDMFETMKLSALLAKGRELDATVIPAEEALHMATVESARIFRLPGLGTLEVGAPADFIALDLSEPNMCPMFNPVSHAVYAASGKDCILTVVDGKALYERGNYLDGMYRETLKQAADLIKWVKDRS